MWVIKIILLVIAALLSLVQLVKEIKDKKSLWYFKIAIILTIFYLGLSITSEILQKETELAEAEKKRTRISINYNKSRQHIGQSKF